MKIKKRLLFTAMLTMLVLTAGCGGADAGQNIQNEASGEQEEIAAAQSRKSETVEDEENNEENEEMKIQLSVNGKSFTASMEKNSATDALIGLLEEGSLTIDMSDYGGFEKVGSLGQKLPASNCQTSTSSGDIVLYQSNQIVVFYGSNSWSYTRLGRVDDLDGWEKALGSGDVSITFSLIEQEKHK